MPSMETKSPWGTRHHVSVVQIEIEVPGIGQQVCIKWRRVTKAKRFLKLCTNCIRHCIEVEINVYTFTSVRTYWILEV